MSKVDLFVHTSLPKIGHFTCILGWCPVSYVGKNYIHEQFANQLLNEWENENIRFQVTRDLGLDGETNFGKRKRGCVIKIEIDAATSKYVY